jgi:hypothetical protein
MVSSAAVVHDPQNVWALEEGEVRRPGIAQIIMTAVLVVVGVFVAVFGHFPTATGLVSTSRPDQAIQAAGSIWYGMWGGIAAAIYPLISNAITGTVPLPVAIAYIPGFFGQAMAAGWAFRQFKCHPALKTGRDWVVWTFIGVLAANAYGALWGTTVQRMFGLITASEQPKAWLDWFIGNSVASWILGALLLRFISPLVIKTKSFCKGYWA